MNHHLLLIEAFRNLCRRTLPPAQEVEELARLRALAQDAGLLSWVHLADGLTAARQKKWPEAIAAYEMAVQLDPDNAWALENLGFAREMNGQLDDALTAYDRIVRKYEGSSALALQEQVATALIGKGIIFSKIGQADDALFASDQIMDLYGERSEVVLQVDVAIALFNKGVTLGMLERRGEEVAAALSNKAAVLGKNRRWEEALGAYNQMVDLFGASPELVLQEQVATALVFKGVVCRILKRREEALLAFKHVVETYGDREEVAFREQVDKALVYQERLTKE